MKKKLKTLFLYSALAILEFLASNGSPFSASHWMRLPESTDVFGCRGQNLAIKNLSKISEVFKDSFGQSKLTQDTCKLDSYSCREHRGRLSEPIFGLLKFLAATPAMRESIPQKQLLSRRHYRQKLCFAGCHLGLANI